MPHASQKVNPNLVVRDEDGKVNAVRYEAVNAMLLNEFLKEHRKAEVEQRKVADLEAIVSKQQKEFHATIAQQQAQIEALTAGLQKVRDEVEFRKPTQRVAVNDN